jgi:hypothetical protein
MIYGHETSYAMSRILDALKPVRVDFDNACEPALKHLGQMQARDTRKMAFVAGKQWQFARYADPGNQDILSANEVSTFLHGVIDACGGEGIFSSKRKNPGQ